MICTLYQAVFSCGQCRRAEIAQWLFFVVHPYVCAYTAAVAYFDTAAVDNRCVRSDAVRFKPTRDGRKEVIASSQDIKANC